MTTNQTIDGVPRELLELIYNGGYCKPHVMDELRALLDAPAVECKAVKRYDRDSVAGHCDVEISLPEHMILHHDPGPNLAEALARLAGRVARFHKLEAPSLAAQPQGEPVAWIKPDVAKTLRKDECCYAFGSQNPKGTLIPLYAEQPAPVAVVQDFGDPYQGAREDLSVWKRRALESEAKVREQDQIIDRLVDAINAENGPTHMGEPSISQWKLPDPHGKQSNLKDTQYAMGWNAYLDEMKRLNPSL